MLAFFNVHLKVVKEIQTFARLEALVKRDVVANGVVVVGGEHLAKRRFHILLQTAEAAAVGYAQHGRAALTPLGQRERMLGRPFPEHLCGAGIALRCRAAQRGPSFIVCESTRPFAAPPANGRDECALTRRRQGQRRLAAAARSSVFAYSCIFGGCTRYR